VGSTINANSRFANSYNSPSYLAKTRTPFNSALLLYGFEAFFVTILEVLPPYKFIIWPRETMWRAILNPSYNRAVLSGTTAGIINRSSNKTLQQLIGGELDAPTLTAPFGGSEERKNSVSLNNFELQTNNLGDNLGLKLEGALNPFYGKKHNQVSRDAISSTKGETIYAYIVNTDKSLTAILPPFVSGNKASLALGITRQTIRHHAKSGKPFTAKNKQAQSGITYLFSFNPVYSS
jgi:group I intron endonuclease